MMDSVKTVEEIMNVLNMQEEILQFTHFTNEDALDFQQFFNDSSVTNKVLASYSCAVSGGVAQVSAAINLQTQSRIVTENFDMGFIQTNGIWKIYRWQ